MVKGSKLKAALERHQGIDHKVERQKKLQKEAGKRKRQKAQKTQAAEVEIDRDDVDAELVLDEFDSDNDVANLQLQEEEIAAKIAELVRSADGAVDGVDTDKTDENSHGDRTDSEGEEGSVDGENGGFEFAMEDESDSDSDDEEAPVLTDGQKQSSEGQRTQTNDDDEEHEDIPLSDIESLASEDKADVVPHQRLTIKNTAALQRSLKSFALPSSLSFAANQSVTSEQVPMIADVDDDLNRELAFYQQSLDAVSEARARLKKEGVPFSRPADYFAEMVKSEEQMGKVRSKMLDEAARKKASADAKRQRDLKKFGKAVQVAKLQERQKEKRETMDRINTLKRKRQGADLTTNEDEMFDVALEAAGETAKNDRIARRAHNAENGPNRKRQKKDAKFGFGGKKRFAKSNDAKSAGDMSGFSTKRMKAGKPSKSRPGKSRRAKMS